MTSSDLSEIRVKLLFFAQFREALGERQRVVVARRGATSSELLNSLVEENPRLGGIVPTVRVMVNGEFAAPDSPLNNDDEVVFLPPVAGG